MPNPHTDLAPIIGPPPPPPMAAAPIPWTAALAGLALALVLGWLLWRLGATRRRLACLQRAALVEDPRRVAGQLAHLLVRWHRLPYLSPALCPSGTSAAAWAAWAEALDALRFGAPPGDRAQLAQLCRDARSLLPRARKC